jgi:hypothetical protein
MNNDDSGKATTADTNINPSPPPAIQSKDIEPSIPDWVFKVIGIKTKQSTVHQEQSEQEKHKAENAIVDRIKKSDRLMILLTAIIACTGIAGAVITTCQTSIMRRQLNEMRDGSKDTKAIAEAAKQQAQDTGLLAGAAKNQATDTEKLAVATKDLAAAAAAKQAAAAISQIGELKASVKAAQEMASSSREANNIAQGANKIALGALQAAQRPWVGFSKPIIVTEPLTFRTGAKYVSIKLEFWLKNFGVSVATATFPEATVIFTRNSGQVARIMKAICAGDDFMSSNRSSTVPRRRDFPWYWVGIWPPANRPR